MRGGETCVTVGDHSSIVDSYRWGRISGMIQDTASFGDYICRGLFGNMWITMLVNRKQLVVFRSTPE